jgi:hypothetical protein
MTDLVRKIHKATQDLKRLEQDLWPRFSEVEDCPLSELDAASLRELKMTVDYVRQLLWNYVEADAHKRGGNSETLRSIRLERVTEMLRSIQDDVKRRDVAESPAAVTFLHAVQEIADAAFERHTAREEEKAS